MDLVTGATGFIGAHLVEALVANGRRVRCLVRDRARASALEGPLVEVRQGNLEDTDFVARSLDGVSRVFHLVGGGKVSAMSGAGLATLRAANVAPLDAMLRGARGADLRCFVHFSSISAMGVQLDVRLDEESPCRPGTPHEDAKFESEALALDAWRAGVPVVVLRPSMTYGPADTRSEIPKLVRLARRGLVPLFGGGEGLVPWVFVSDVIDATLAAAERTEAVGRTYIVAREDSYRFADVVQAIAHALGRRRGGMTIPSAVAWPAFAAAEAGAAVLGREPPFTRHRLASLCGRRTLSIDRARRELGYSPRVDLREGMTRTVRWYVEHGLV
jgi:nucleoside-diphosphate-sugar epimerase